MSSMKPLSKKEEPANTRGREGHLIKRNRDRHTPVLHSGVLWTVLNPKATHEGHLDIIENNRDWTCK